MEHSEEDTGTWKYCLSCSDEFYTPTGRARLCPECRGRKTIRDSEEEKQELYRQGIIPETEGNPNEDDWLEIEDDPFYDEEDIYDLFGIEDEDAEDEEDWGDY